MACGDCFVMTHDLFIRAIFPTAKFENVHKARLCKDHFSQFQYLSSLKSSCKTLQNLISSIQQKWLNATFFSLYKIWKFFEAFAGMVGWALTLKYGGVNAERSYKWEKKISNALQCRRSTFKRPGEINPLTHDDPWALSSDIEHLKKEKKCYLWVKNRLPLSKHSNFTRWP